MLFTPHDISLYFKDNEESKKELEIPKQKSLEPLEQSNQKNIHFP